MKYYYYFIISKTIVHTVKFSTTIDFLYLYAHSTNFEIFFRLFFWAVKIKKKLENRRTFKLSYLLILFEFCVWANTLTSTNKNWEYIKIKFIIIAMTFFNFMRNFQLAEKKSKIGRIKTCIFVILSKSVKPFLKRILFLRPESV